MGEPRIERTASRIEVRIGEEVVFSDSTDHFSNGVARLLGVSQSRAEEFVLAAARRFSRSSESLGSSSRIATLAEAWRDVMPMPESPNVSIEELPGLEFGSRFLRADRLWASSIGADPRYCMVGCGVPAHAWLVDRTTMARVLPEGDIYEEDYFEGKREGLGYGDYLGQADWRLEKAARQVRQVRGLLEHLGARTENETIRLLDVGAGYGFFRQAAEAVGIEHEGTEISQHAADVAQRLFAFETRLESLSEVAASSPRRFDVIVMWDFLEHVPDAVEAVSDAYEALVPGGHLFVRTPNLLAEELQVFGPSYHSLKLEHLHMFSPDSLSKCFFEGRLLPRLVLSESHMLQGFAEIDVNYAAATLRGSDLLAVAQRPG